ncbi:hypothetical protein ACQB60_25935 [Actinomycetota bacterium Odt1-20B]
MKEIITIIGWVVGIQGALGVLGRLFTGDSWGLLQKWWDIPTPGYLVLFVLGAALAIWGETSKQRARSRG